MRQVVARWFGDDFHVTQTGGSRDGGVDVWVQRRGNGGGGGAEELFECAVQIKRYSAPLSDASVREFCDKIGTKAKRGIFIAPTGFGPGAREFAVRPKACAPLPLVAPM